MTFKSIPVNLGSISFISKSDCKNYFQDLRDKYSYNVVITDDISEFEHLYNLVICRDKVRKCIKLHGDIYAFKVIHENRTSVAFEYRCENGYRSMFSLQKAINVAVKCKIPPKMKRTIKSKEFDLSPTTRDEIDHGDKVKAFERFLPYKTGKSLYYSVHRESATARFATIFSKFQEGTKIYRNEHEKIFDDFRYLIRYGSGWHFQECLKLSGGIDYIYIDTSDGRFYGVCKNGKRVKFYYYQLAEQLASKRFMAFNKTLDTRSQSFIFGHNGYVYIMLNPAFDNVVKIGWSADVKQRVSQLSIGAPVDYEVVFKIKYMYAYELEQITHFWFSEYNVNREFFNIECLEAVKTFLSEYVKKNT